MGHEEIILSRQVVQCRQQGNSRDNVTEGNVLDG